MEKLALRKEPEPMNDGPGPIQRRKFLGLGLSGFAGASLPRLLPSPASAASAKPATAIVTEPTPTKESTYGERTDSFAEKMRLLTLAWEKKDYRLARALTNSLRTTAIQAQAEEESPGTPLVPAARHDAVASLPGPWKKWAQGWRYFKTVTLNELLGRQRTPEPVEIVLGFPVEQITSLAREIRVAHVVDGHLRELPSQVHGEVRRGSERYCKLVFIAEGQAGQPQTLLVFYGNPDAELPAYPTDLVTAGEGFGLDVENGHYKASLSRQMGQLERLTLKREHGLELFSGGEGHGEPPGIDWAHDYVSSGYFQKLRITLWDKCPDYEVVRGPLCTIIRRWGFPYSPVHPLISPSRLNIDVEYRFYAGLPWFQKVARMQAVKSFEAEALRDDEWVFSGQSFTDMVWLGPDGKLHMGAVDPALADNLWGVGFFHKESQDSFIALFLEHRADGLPELKHAGAPTMFYRWHGNVWSRYPLPGKQVPAGAVLHEKNAYVALPFTPTEGPRRIENLREQLMKPWVAAAGELPKGINAQESRGKLARPGEAGDSPISKRALWEALRDCKDAQLYTADINVVDLGLVYDLRVRGETVQVVMAMPHRGRPRLGYFINGSNSVHPTLSLSARECLLRVPGVRQVVVEQTWEPGWSSNQLTDAGRKKFGM